MNNYIMKNALIFTASLFAIFWLTACQTTSQPPPVQEKPAAVEPKKLEAEDKSYVFGWGALPSEIAKPRGGTTRGTPVEIAPARSLPLEEIASQPDAFERDRAAILSLAGNYKASFHFLETMGLFPEHKPARPYHSWSTEQVRVLEDHGEFISLQHTLVMHFQQEDGSIIGPIVMKHWRQDWTYQDTDLHTFRGAGTWERDTRSPDSVKGAWSQAVWQVDDSPRYEAIGRWKHEGNRSLWIGENSWRPLPRREYSVRDDYGVMEGFHRIIITPTGWIHEQNNWKRVAGDSAKTPDYRGHEIGLDRYELITSPDLSKADEYWEKTGPYWAAVRQVWKEVYAEKERFSLKGKVDGRSQFEHHFEYAGTLDEGEPWDPEAGAAFAREIIAAYLGDEAEAASY